MVPSDELLPRAVALAARPARAPPHMLRAMKDNLDVADVLSLPQHLAGEGARFVEARLAR